MDPNNNPTDPGQGAPVDPVVPTTPVGDTGVQPEGVPPVTPEPSVPTPEPVVPTPEPSVETPVPNGAEEPSWNPEPAPSAPEPVSWNPEPTTTPPAPEVDAPVEPVAPVESGENTGGSGTV